MTRTMKAYYIAEHEGDSDWAEEYSMLKGPGGFECCLTEPEDRVWYRDGYGAIKELNRLHAENERLKKALERTKLEELRHEALKEIWATKESESYEQTIKRLNRTMKKFFEKAQALKGELESELKHEQYIKEKRK